MIKNIAKHSKRIGAAILAVLICISLFACGQKNNSNENTANSPGKVAVLYSSYAGIWQLAGGTVDITVGETVDRGFVNADSVVLVDSTNGYSSIDVEALAAQKPDLVIISEGYGVQPSVAEQCKALGIEVRAYSVDCFEDYLSVLKEMCELTGHPENYSKYGTDIEENVKGIRAAAAESLKLFPEAPTYLFIRAGATERSTKVKTGNDVFAAAMLDELGAENIADSAPYLLDSISIEQILLLDPDLIFFTTQGDENAAKDNIKSMLESPGWSSLSAVKDGKVFILEKDLFHYKPNERWDLAYRKLAEILYPGF